MVVKTSISFLSKDAAQVVANKTDVVLDAMPKAIAIYAKPSPALAIVTTANDALKTAILNSAAAGGGKQLTAIVNARKAEVVSLMRQLAGYVTATADGNLEKLLASGFPIQKPTRSPIGQLPAPDAPSVTQGVLSGQVKAATPPLYGGMAYNWRVALASAPTVYVQTVQTTAASTLFDGLTPGEIYNVEVSTVGSAGPSDWSDAGSLMVI